MTDVASTSPETSLVPSARPGLSCPARWTRSALGLSRHYRIEPSRKKAPLLKHSNKGHKVPTYVPPLIPCLFADVVGHPIQLVRGAVQWWTAMLPRPLGSEARIRALSRSLPLDVVPLKVDLFQAMPRPILAEVHPRKIGILSVVIDDP